MLQRALGTLILIIHSHQSLLRHVLVKKCIWVIFYYAMEKQTYQWEDTLPFDRDT